jgi:hypothetical protein
MKKIDKIIEKIRENVIASGGSPTKNLCRGNSATFEATFFRK